VRFKPNDKLIGSNINLQTGISFEFQIFI